MTKRTEAVSGLKGVDLDMTVARAESITLGEPMPLLKAGSTPPPYSSDWLWAGPIIDRERITITQGWTSEKILACIHVEHDCQGYYRGCYSWKCRGDTAMEAAMRSYCRKVFGDYVTLGD